MSSVSFIFYWLLSLTIFIGLIALTYYIIKKAVKNGILEAYKQIHKP